MYCEMIHKLRNELAVVAGQCELIVRGGENRSTDERLRAIQAATKSMADLLSAHECKMSEVIGQNVAEIIEARRIMPGAVREAS